MARKSYIAMQFQRNPQTQSNSFQFVRVERQTHSPRGLVHKAVHFKQTRIIGDVPTVGKAIANWKPSTPRGKLLKMGVTAGHFYGSIAGKAAVKTALITETVALKAGGRAAHQAGYALLNKYRYAGRDDMSRAAAKATIHAGRAVRYIGVSIQAGRVYKAAKRRNSSRSSWLKLRMAQGGLKNSESKLKALKKKKYEFVKKKYGSIADYAKARKAPGFMKCHKHAVYLSRVAALERQIKARAERLSNVKYNRTRHGLKHELKAAKREYSRYGKMRKFRLTAFKTEGVKHDLRRESRKLKKKIRTLNKEKYADLRSFRLTKRKTGLQRQLNDRRNRLAKHDLKIVKHKSKAAKSELKFKQKIYKTNKRLLRSARTATIRQAGVDLGKSTLRKFAREAGENDFINLVEGSVKIVRTVSLPKTTAHKLHKQQAGLSKLQKKSSVKAGKLKVKESKLQSSRNAIAKRNKRRKLRKKAAKDKANRILSALARPRAAAKKLAEAAGKKIVTAIAPFLFKVLLIAIPLFMLLTMCVPMSSFVVLYPGSFMATDRDLTRASEYYTGLAHELNSRILEIPNNWAGQLSALGADFSGWLIPPIVFTFGNAPELRCNPVYDYDPFRLWAFISAYYYEIPPENPESDEPYQQEFWAYNSGVENLITALFERQYSFVYRYRVVYPRESPPYGVLNYGVHSNQSFEETIRLFLAELPGFGERWEYYQLLSGTMPPNPPGTPTYNIYGGHQVLNSPLSRSIPELWESRSSSAGIMHVNGYDLLRWNSPPCPQLPDGFHAGIDILTPVNEPIFAVGAGTVRNVTATGFELYIENIPVFADSDNTYAAVVRYGNARLLPGIGAGDVVQARQEIGRVTDGRMCGSIGGSYLHLQFTANGANIDPLLIFL